MRLRARHSLAVKPKLGFGRPLAHEPPAAWPKQALATTGPQAGQMKDTALQLARTEGQYISRLHYSQTTSTRAFATACTPPAFHALGWPRHGHQGCLPTLLPTCLPDCVPACRPKTVYGASLPTRAMSSSSLWPSLTRSAAPALILPGALRRSCRDWERPWQARTV